MHLCLVFWAVPLLCLFLPHPTLQLNSFFHIPFTSNSLVFFLGQNFCLDWCKQPDVGLPKPDLILFLQLSLEEAAERGNFGNERYENSSFQEKVLQSYYHLMKDKTLNWKVREER